MKKFKYLLLLALGAMMATSCYKSDNDDRVIYLGFSTVEKASNDAMMLLLDNGVKLNPQNAVVSSPIGQRVIISFSLGKEYESGTPFDYDADIYGSRGVLTKGIAKMTAANQDSIGNDGFYSMNGITWGGGFLNTYFGILYNGIPHTITMADNAVNGEQVVTDTLKLELRQNAKGQNSGYWLNGLASFNIQSYLDAAKANSRDTLIVRVTTNLIGGTTSKYDIHYPTSYYGNFGDEGLTTEWLNAVTGVE